MNNQYRCENKIFYRNYFDLLRLIAAFQVALTHGIIHFKIELLYTLVWWLNFIPGVPMYFFLSGLLISASWEQKPELKHYLKKRFYRIFPVLWVCVIITSVIITSFSLIQKEDMNIGSLMLRTVLQGTIFQQWNPEFLNWFGIGVANI